MSAANILGSDHVGFTVTSLEESLAFWNGALGLEIAYQVSIDGELTQQLTGVTNPAMNIALLPLPGGLGLELIEYTSPEGRMHYKPRSCDVGSVHLALKVNDLDGIVEKAKALGWAPVNEPLMVPMEPESFLSGTRLVYLRGPDGETIELLEPPAEDKKMDQ